MNKQSLRAVRISGTGSYLPERIVTNHDLAQWMDTSDEWIKQRSGISERRYASAEESPIDLAEKAARSAIEAAGLVPADIDMVLVATLSPHAFFPGNSVFLQERLGLGGKPAMDVRCQCSGFLYGLNVAQLFIASGQYQRVLLCGVEIHSRGLDFTTRGRDVAVLFGDGAGAVVLEEEVRPEHGMLDVRLHADGQFADKLWMPFPGMAKNPYISKEMIDEGMIYPKMEGRFVFKHAVTRLCEVVGETLDAHHLSPTDIDHYVFHQANLRINEAVLDELKVPGERAYNNIMRYGNCSAASIPICLDEMQRAGRFKSGELLMMASFGSGFTWASCLMRL